MHGKSLSYASPIIIALKNFFSMPRKQKSSLSVQGKDGTIFSRLHQYEAYHIKHKHASVNPRNNKKVSFFFKHSSFFHASMTLKALICFNECAKIFFHFIILFSFDYTDYIIRQTVVISSHLPILYSPNVNCY